MLPYFLIKRLNNKEKTGSDSHSPIFVERILLCYLRIEGHDPHGSCDNDENDE